MTIDEAWTIVLEKYHDELPPEFQWRPDTKCEGIDIRRAPEADTQSITGIAWQCKCGAVLYKWTDTGHAKPRPPVTDAAVMAVLRAMINAGEQIGLHGELAGPDEITPRYYVKAVGYHDVLGWAGDPRDAIILAAAELAKRK